MAQRADLEQRLAALHALRDQAGTEQSRQQLTDALAAKTNLLAARAAAIIAEARLDGFEHLLQRAFTAFLRQSDKGCAAKTAIARALYELGASTDDLFLTGARHVQLESSYGGPVDVAAELRGYCALGLVRMAHRDAMLVLTDLLADPQLQARIFAARGLAYSERPEAALLLRLKLLLGDPEPDVMAECMAALVKLAPAAALPLLAKFLEHADPAVAGAAAMAIGESRQPEAFDLLRQHWDRSIDPEARRAAALGLAMLRTPQSLDYLLAQLREAETPSAEACLAALQIYQRDASVRSQIEHIVHHRRSPKLTQTFTREFAP